MSDGSPDFAERLSENTLSVFIVISSAAWGLYWFPLRGIEATGMSGAWSVVFFNACPLVVLLPLLLFKAKMLVGTFSSTLLVSVLVGSAFTCYANALIETTVIRATMLFYLTPVWSTLIGVIWLSEPLTRARIISIFVAFAGLFLLLSNGDSTNTPLNIGDFYGLLAGIFWAFGLSMLNRYPTIPIAPLTALTFVSTTVLSVLFALLLGSEVLPDAGIIKEALPTALIWSIFLLPCFFVIFRISQILFPGRVGILTMSEVVVAVISASILLPDEAMGWVQWIGAIAIIAAGLIEVVFGYTSSHDISTARMENESG